MPLYFLQGFVDDADQHSDEAYNETLALQGYDIIVSASDGYSKTFSSVDTVRSTGYIVANTLNGYNIPEDSSSWPLRLVGDDVSKKDNVKAVSDIILNLRPEVGEISVDNPAAIGEDVLFSADVSDPYDTLTAVWDFGDGSTETIEDAEGSISTAHAYAESGFYTATLTVTDTLGAEAQSVHEYVIVYDPTCTGEVSGSGTMDDGLGFSLIVKYKKEVAGGNVGFNLPDGSKFKADSIDWIIIKDDCAWIAGSGSLDKASGYDFQLVVTNGKYTGEPDTLRLFLTSGDETIYNNEPEASIIDLPATAIGGGNIEIKAC
jgi:PKD repeat protein